MAKTYEACIICDEWIEISSETFARVGQYYAHIRCYEPMRQNEEESARKQAEDAMKQSQSK